MKKKGFTLIELIISIVILSILMLFLYKSYASLNKSNVLFAKEVKKIEKMEKIKKTLYIDFSVAMAKSVTIISQSRDIDIVFLQTNNSIHQRINPYVAYVVNNKKLYRLESLKPLKEYPFGADSEFVTDYLGEVKSFRLYKSQEKKSEVYLVNVVFKNSEEILLKTEVFNSK
jgi:prepilin-type N-terminal cleavage/methylation domain-containing protein